MLFSERCKLFRWADGQWKERGLGNMKLLKHKMTTKARLVMRREQVRPFVFVASMHTTGFWLWQTCKSIKTELNVQCQIIPLCLNAVWHVIICSAFHHQVLKVCCNHHVAETIHLTAMPSCDRAMVWMAYDFADGESKNEKFAAKFKTTEIAENFRDLVNEEAKKLKEQYSSEKNVQLHRYLRFQIEELMSC